MRNYWRGREVPPTSTAGTGAQVGHTRAPSRERELRYLKFGGMNTLLTSVYMLCIHVVLKSFFNQAGQLFKCPTWGVCMIAKSFHNDGTWLDYISLHVRSIRCGRFCFRKCKNNVPSGSCAALVWRRLWRWFQRCNMKKRMLILTLYALYSFILSTETELFPVPIPSGSSVKGQKQGQVWTQSSCLLCFECALVSAVCGELAAQQVLW